MSSLDITRRRTRKLTLDDKVLQKGPRLNGRQTTAAVVTPSRLHLFPGHVLPGVMLARRHVNVDLNIAALDGEIRLFVANVC